MISFVQLIGRVHFGMGVAEEEIHESSLLLLAFWTGLQSLPKISLISPNTIAFG